MQLSLDKLEYVWMIDYDATCDVGESLFSGVLIIYANSRDDAESEAKRYLRMNGYTPERICSSAYQPEHVSHSRVVCHKNWYRGD